MNNEKFISFNRILAAITTMITFLVGLSIMLSPDNLLMCVMGAFIVMFSATGFGFNFASALREQRQKNVEKESERIRQEEEEERRHVEAVNRRRREQELLRETFNRNQNLYDLGSIRYQDYHRINIGHNWERYQDLIRQERLRAAQMSMPLYVSNQLSPELTRSSTGSSANQQITPANEQIELKVIKKRETKNSEKVEIENHIQSSIKQHTNPIQDLEF